MAVLIINATLQYHEQSGFVPHLVSIMHSLIQAEVNP